MAHVEIPLHPAKHGLVALVDECDAERVLKHRWNVRFDKHTQYAHTRVIENGVHRWVQLHRFVLGCKPGEPWVDHINHNGLDNTRANLRLVTPSQNHMNRRTGYGSSQFKGVYRAPNGRWQAQFKKEKLGRFSVEEEAARAYDLRAWHADREHCDLNFPLAPGQQPREPIHDAPIPGRSKHSPGQRLELVRSGSGYVRRWVPWPSSTTPAVRG